MIISFPQLFVIFCGFILLLHDVKGFFEIVVSQHKYLELPVSSDRYVECTSLHSIGTIAHRYNGTIEQGKGTMVYCVL